MKSNEKSNLGRRVAKIGGWTLAKRLSKSIPFAGTAIALGLAGDSIRRKGFAKGALDAGLDAIPFVGTAKTVIEIFSGDLIPDKSNVDRKR